MVAFTDGTTSGVETKDMIPALGVKMIQMRVPATFVWGTDTMVVDLNNYGAKKVSGVIAFEETTAGSVVVAASAGTTAVSGTTLTYTSAGAGTNGGTIIIFAY